MAGVTIGTRIRGALKALTGGSASEVALTLAGQSGLARLEREYELDASVIGSLEELRHQRSRIAAGARLPAWQTSTPQLPTLNYRTFINQGYRSNTAVRACVDLLGRTFRQGFVEIYDRETASAVDHDIPALLRKPTNARGEKERWNLTIQDLYLTGNAYWQKDRRAGSPEVFQLIRLDPQRIRIQPSHDKWIDFYLLEVGGIEFRIPAEDVIHWKFPDPQSVDFANNWFGIPPLLSAIRVLSVDNQLVDQLKISLQNKAIPSVVLEYDVEDQLDEEKAEEARRIFRKRYGGEHLGDVAVTDAKVKVIGMNWKEMDIGTVITVPERQIARVHGTPMELIGSSTGSEESGLSSESTRREANLHFWQNTVMPLQEDVAELLEIFLLPEFPGWEGLGVRFNTTNVPVLQAARLERMDKARGLFKDRLASRHVAQRAGGMEIHGPDVFAADAHNPSVAHDAIKESPPGEET